MTHSRLTTAAALLGLLLAAAAPRCSADNGPTSKNSMKGLPGVGVVIEYLKPEVEKAGLTYDQLTTDVELRLRQSGIEVLTEQDRIKTPGRPFLYVNVNAVPEGTLLTYSVDVALEQDVALARDPAGLQSAVTWSIGCVGRSNADGVRQAVRDWVDRFANDFLSVNPKR